jgi:hypothetical protein
MGRRGAEESPQIFKNFNLLLRNKIVYNAPRVYYKGNLGRLSKSLMK